MKVTDINIKAKEIITEEDALCQDCEFVDFKKPKEKELVQEIVLALKATMKENNLNKLAAPQIGYNRAIFCIRYGEDKYTTYINPMYTGDPKTFFLSEETCASLPGRRFIIPRCSKISAFYTTPLGEPKSIGMAGVAATAFTQCAELLSGMLVSDIGLEIDELWDNASEEEKNEVVALYLESLDLGHKKMNEYVENDEELKKIVDASKFIASVQSGDTVIEPIPSLNNCEGNTDEQHKTEGNN